MASGLSGCGGGWWENGRYMGTRGGQARMRDRGRGWERHGHARWCAGVVDQELDGVVRARDSRT
eukprot:3163454-Rhodomonas_salina.1